MGPVTGDWTGTRGRVSKRRASLVSDSYYYLLFNYYCLYTLYHFYTIYLMLLVSGVYYTLHLMFKSWKLGSPLKTADIDIVLPLCCIS